MTHRLITATALGLALSASVLSACGGSSGSEPAASSASADPGSAAPSGDASGGGNLSPVDDVCALVSPTDLGDLLADAGQPTSVKSAGDPEQVCSYSSPSGGTLSLLVDTQQPGQERFDGLFQFEDVSGGAEMIGDLGFTAAYAAEGPNNAVMDAVLNGWYVQVRVEGADQEDPKDALLQLADTVRQRMVAMPSDSEAGAGSASPEGAGDTTAPAATDDVALRLEVTEPASLATVITEASLGDGAQVLCPVPGAGGPWLVNGQANLLGGGVGAEGPLARLSLAVDAGIQGPGTYDGNITMTTTDDQTDLGGPGTIVVEDGERSGSFAVATTEGDMSGTWAC
ncbi:MAG: hypothetical protein R2754_02580 [Microthrixaceae bacterium]